ncbi:addiction module toxin RelE [Streptococcus raffinosi]|uniref:Addiction module toxin RelE n=1 Tax=Streptococcus raffinosi TaxID=3053355 RepID=A0ABT7LSB4_9STRE|nr:MULTISPECIES: addiction module toxin RelE [unclassified Streptococcus]MDL5043422.1 addiction module toxin RelE [Streptococcus sp. VTCC 12812]MDM0094540.1 addiction module toxin RelE [Streptococcus sp. VTCC 12813]
MKLIYTNKTVEKQCTELRRAKKDFSDKVALKLHQLINLLEASDSLASVTAFPKYHFHQLRGKRNGQFALDIDVRRSSYRLIVGFREEDFDKVFSSPVEIEILKIEEVSNHYE